MMLKRQWRKAVLAGAATMAAAGVGGGLVFAMSTSNSAPAQAAAGISAQVSPTATASPASPQAPQAVNDAVNQFLHDLAGHLNVDEQTLRDALEQTALDQVDQAEQSGKLTTDQASKLRDAINKAASGDTSGFEGLIPGLLPGIIGKGGLTPNNPNKPSDQGKPGMPGVLGKLGSSLDALATFLGTDQASLMGELRGGKSLAQIADAHGKTRDQLKSFLSDQSHQALKQAVDGGKMTQAAADKAQQAFDSHLDSVVDLSVPAFDFGHRGAKPGSTPTPGATP